MAQSDKFQRRGDFTQSGRKDKAGIVDNEIKRLLRENTHHLTHADLIRLKEKYNDDEIVDQIQDELADKLKKIRSRAAKFAKLIKEKYDNSNYPLHKLLQKARKYKQKYNLTDAEFDEFQRIYERYIAGEDINHSTSLNLNVPKTNVSKALGTIITDAGDGVRYDEHEAAALQEILKLYAASKPLHSQVVVQSLTYSDLSVEALTGQYDRNKHNPSTHIHPVLAAFYLPKIQLMDDHTLLANIGGIINSRYNKQPIHTKPDYELFYDLISDPNDVVCDKNSTIMDLHKRANLQVQLWKCVQNLRSGKYYDQCASDFLMAIDNCKLSHFDTPDLLYAGDEGVVLRRLLSAFSLRPTVVATTPAFQQADANPFRIAAGMPRVNALPMVQLRLPVANASDMGPIKLTDALDQQQLFLEHNTIVPKNQSIIYSKGMLVFHVNRRAHALDIAKLTDPFNFTKLPVSVAGFERINTRDVIVTDSITIRGENYSLRSVVLIDTNPQVPDLVIGCSTAIRKPVDYNAGTFQDEYFLYNPRLAAQVTMVGNQAMNLTPITALEGTPTITQYGTPSFYQLAQKYGTVFVYCADSNSVPDSKLLF